MIRFLLLPVIFTNCLSYSIMRCFVSWESGKDGDADSTFQEFFRHFSTLSCLQILGRNCGVFFLNDCERENMRAFLSTSFLITSNSCMR